MFIAQIISAFFGKSSSSSTIVAQVLDSYFNSTVLLINGETSKLPFTADASTNALVISPFGSVRNDTFSPFDAGYYSGLFNGSTDYLSCAPNSQFDMGAGDFTVEAWVYLTSAQTAKSLLSVGGSTTLSILLWLGGTQKIEGYFSADGSTWQSYTLGATSVPVSSWNHVAYVKSGSTLRVYLNGVSDGTQTGSASGSASSGKTLYIGSRGGDLFNGYISNARIVKGTAVYTSAFTPATTPLTAITGTSLLTLQDARFKDSSTNNFSLTINGTPKVTGLSPFTYTPTAASANFNGTSDCITTSTATAPGTVFTVEGWAYPTGFVTSETLLIYGVSSGFQLGHNGTAFGIAANGAAWVLTGTTGLTLNVWNHFAVVRTGTGAGQTSIFVNGVRTANGQVTQAFATAATITIGASTTSTYQFPGYLSNIRIVSGTALYDPSLTALTIPTAPLTAITGTQLLTLQNAGPASNNGFLDSSANNFAITRVGTPTQGTFSPFSNAGWSGYFNGSTDYLTLLSSTNFAFSGNFTMEAWIYPTASTTGRIFSFANTDEFLILPANTISYFDGTTNFTTTSTVALNTWSHVAVAKVGTTVTVYINGIAGFTSTSTYTTTAARALTIGRYGPSALNFFSGYISNARIVNGTAVYTSNFIPSTTPLTAITNTVLLTLQDNRFKDNSTNAFALTVNGTPSIQAMSPFAVTTSYSAAVNGGSMYFNGTTDYLSVPANTAFAFGTGNFTWEAWLWISSSTNNEFEIWESQTSGAFVIYKNSSGANNAICYRAYGSADRVIVATASIPYSQWFHLAVSRSSGTITAYLNGVQTYNQNDSTNFATPTVAYTIAGRNGGSLYMPSGYISNLRIVKDTALYTAAFTPSAAPLTAITGTQLLLNGVNQGVVDFTGKNNITTVGSVVSNTAQKKYGNQSLYFNGSSYVTIPATQNLAFGTGDFTIECWVYLLDKGKGIFHVSTTSVLPSSVTGIAVAVDPTTGWNFYAANSQNSTGPIVSLSTWYHVAVVRSSGTTTLYINGVANQSRADTTNYTGTFGAIGGFYSTSYLTACYIDDFRITRGVARYPGNYMPTTAFGDNSTVDPYFNNVALLLHGDGASYTAPIFNNNTFVDSSANALILSRSGTPTQGTFSPFSNAGWGGYFDGSNYTYLTTASVAALGIGTGSYTIEGWFNITGTPGVNSYVLIDLRDVGVSAGTKPSIALDSAKILSVWYGNTKVITGPTLSLNTWYHIAIVRSGTTLTLYINGTAAGTATNDTYNIGTTAHVTIGNVGDASGTYNACYIGYMSNIRIVNGTAVYTSNFTPSTTPLTAVTGTSLLTLQDSRFKDNSTNNLTLTVSGTPSIQAISPFPVTTSYSAAVNGGSIYFNGSTDYLTVTGTSAFAFGTGNFTIEAWVYLRSYPSGSLSGTTPFGTTNGALTGYYLNLGQNIDTLRFTSNASGSWADNVTVTAGNGVPLNSWTHVAFVRNGGTLTLYKNGIVVASATGASSFNFTSPNNAGYIGLLSNVDATQYFPGYLSGVRVVANAVYTAAFTPSTAPLTAITGTSLLLNGVAGGLIDGTGKNDLVTVGTAATSTAVVKYGTGAMYFNGSTDYVALSGTSQLFAFGTGDFTIEAWGYRTATGLSGFIDMRPAGNTASITPVIYINASNKFCYYVNGADRIVGTTTTATSTWYHVAICRSSGSTKLFINGVQEGSTYTDANAYVTQANRPIIGCDGGPTNYFAGYIDDLRITRGVARYGVFTPSTIAFGDNSTTDPYFNNVALLVHGDGVSYTTPILDNNTFVDSSANALILSRSGTPTQGTFSPFSNAGWSAYFNGTTASLSVPDNANLNFGTGNFTIEAWVYQLSSSGTQHLVHQGAGGTNYQARFSITWNSTQWVYNLSSDGYSFGIANGVSMGTNPGLNTWFHIALVRNGNVFTPYINGIAGTTTTSTLAVNAYLTPLLAIGNAFGAGGDSFFNGYISNVRIVKGTAVYTQTFTPATTPLTAISGTAVLTCQNNRFVDNSSFAATVTPNNASIQAMSPFAVTTSYSAAVNGGSMLFNGSTDYISTTSVAGSALDITTGSWTMEAWIYPLSFNGPQYSCAVMATDRDSILLRANPTTGNSTTMNMYMLDSGGNGPLGSSGTSSSISIYLNQWSHVALVRNGSTFTLYINGVSGATASTSSNIRLDTTFWIGRGSSGSNPYWNGYISNARVVKGTAVYTSAFTPSTTPLTAVTNTSLLLNGISGSVFDATGKTDVVTVGDVKVSTTQSKWGGSSIYFDGSGDYLNLPVQKSLEFGSSNWTVEMWFNTTTPTTRQTLVFLNGNTVGGYAALCLDILTTAKIGISISESNGSWKYSDSTTGTGSVISANTWYHVAVTRSGSTIAVFLNGTSILTTQLTAATTSLMTTYTVNQIGVYNSGYYYLNGYIDDLRITRGVARYTSSFTAPAAKLADNSTGDANFNNTVLLLQQSSQILTRNTYKNNVVLDSSTNSLNFNVTGSPTQGTFSPFSNTGWSTYFNGSNGDYITLGSSSVVAAMGGKQTTIEMWINCVGIRAVTAYSMALMGNSQGVAANGRFNLSLSGSSTTSTQQLVVYYTTSTAAASTITASAAMSQNTWNHIAVTIDALTSSSATIVIYINGVGQTFTGINLSTHTADPGINVLLANNYGDQTFNGYISNLRVTRSLAYTSNFTVPTAPLTAITGTTLLTLQDNRFKDNSTNNLALTVTGTPSIQAASPFAVTTTYSAATNGGSLYFNGTSAVSTDYNSISTILYNGLTSTSTFTIEAWVYCTQYTTGDTTAVVGDMAHSSGTNNWSFGLNNSGLVYFYWYAGGGYNAKGNTVVPLNTWAHIAVSISSGSIKLFTNGLLQTLTGTATMASSLSSVAYLSMGMWNGGGASYGYYGYVSNLRIIKGTALYSTTFIPSTTPLTAVTNTSLLLNTSNIGVSDTTGKNDIVLFGNTQASFNNSKFGSGALSFDGSTGYATIPSSPNFAFRASDFTIEMWVYQLAASSGNPSLVSSNYSYSTGAGDWAFYYVASGSIYFNSGSASSSGTNHASTVNHTIPLNNWTHVAYSRSSGVGRFFINGVQLGTDVTDTTSYSSTGLLYIGSQADGSGKFSGYIDDLRITRGVARYTVNFTAPAAQLPDNSTNDSNFNNTVLLLQGNIQNVTRTVAKNNVVLDSSSNALAVTATGTPTQGTFSPFSNAGWSGYFGSSTDNLAISSNAAFAFGTGDFTVEMWINLYDTNANQRFYLNGQGGTDYVNMAIATNGVLQVGINNTYPINYTIPAGFTNNWNHLALVRLGPTLSLYLNGNSVATASNSTNLSSSFPTYIGGLTWASGYSAHGYMSNVRVVKGTAVYTSNFTPSTTPLTAIAGTSLLTLQDNRFKDNSTNAFALTVSGTPSIQAISPFPVTTTYSAAVNGGSAYFNGSTDYLTIPTNAAWRLRDTNFTVELWFYPTGNAGAWRQLVGTRSSGGPTSWQLTISNTNGLNYYDGTTYSTGQAIALNTWYHLAVVRNGTTMTFYLNGVLVYSNTLNPNTGGDAQPLGIGANAFDGSEKFAGYISNLRIVNGTAVYTGNFTPSTAPLTAVTNTSLLLNTSNIGVSDSSGKNDLMLSGAAQASAFSKFGNGSLLFDGAGAATGYAVITNKQAVTLGTSDFTIECWVYQTARNTYNFIYNRAIGSANNQTDAELLVTAAGALTFSWYTGSTQVSLSTNTLVPLNAWTHIAVCRIGGKTTAFINGVADPVTSTNTGANNDTASFGWIGNQAPSPTRAFPGWIDEFRITVGVGRYTNTFTPPTAALPQGNFSTPTQISAQYLVVAGGGGGSGARVSVTAASGGGAGGLRTGSTTLLSQVRYIVTVGAGGAGGEGYTPGAGTQGQSSSFDVITSSGGGAGGISGGGGGGSGGGAATGQSVGSTRSGGAGNQGGYTPVEGYDGGGNSNNAPSYNGGGGGGAGGAGGFGNSGGLGGIGVANPISGSTVGELSSGVYYLAGGGGAQAVAGGKGGGGTGSSSAAAGGSGLVYTGGGGGGGHSGSSTSGGAGGSGVVIISCAATNATATTVGNVSVTTSGANRIYTFYSSGSITF